jgi:hypothetical protein
MKRITFLLAFLYAITIFLTTTLQVKAQDSASSSPISTGADIMSRYVWRGTDYGGSPSIQPSIEFSTGGFALGCWGAYTTNLPGVQEMDLYVSYTFSDMVTVGLIDYFFPDEIFGYDYFETRRDSSGHVLEGYASFDGLENLQLTFLIGYNFYNDSHHSIYFELGYSFSIFDVFLGAGNGIYTTDNNFNVVNMGVTASKEIKITEKFGLPVSTSFILNPQAKAVHLVFGISL